MIVHRINHLSTKIESSSAPDEDLAAIGLPGDRTLLSALGSGDAVFFEGFWLFASPVLTVHGMMPVESLSIQAGYTPPSGVPGECGVHFINFTQMVKRGVAIDLVGIERRIVAEPGSLQ